MGDLFRDWAMDRPGESTSTKKFSLQTHKPSPSRMGTDTHSAAHAETRGKEDPTRRSPPCVYLLRLLRFFSPADSCLVAAFLYNLRALSMCRLLLFFFFQPYPRVLAPCLLGHTHNLHGSTCLHIHTRMWM